MSRIRRTALALTAAIALTGCPTTNQSPPPDTDKVAHIVDGDTLDVADGTRVRLIGIDTPERGECGYAEAADRLTQLILGRTVELTPGATHDTDRYGRLLRYVDTPEGDAGLTLITEGLAIARYDSRDGYGHHPRQDAYITADEQSPNRCGSEDS